MDAAVNATNITSPATCNTNTPPLASVVMIDSSSATAAGIAIHSHAFFLRPNSAAHSSPSFGFLHANS